MTTGIWLRDYQKSDFNELLEMGLSLWEDFERNELERELSFICNSNRYKVVLAKTNESYNVGFAIFSIRTDYVEGARMRPTGYLEGIFVRTEYRNRKIAWGLVEFGENWLKRNDCSQIGSDTWLGDKESLSFHKKIGFSIEDELVHFLKDID